MRAAQVLHPASSMQAGKAGVAHCMPVQGKTWEHVDVELEESSPPTWLIEASISGTHMYFTCTREIPNMQVSNHNPLVVVQKPA